ncbi:MAG: lipid-A-disaccharide synthase N-terminal domain-containing protein [Gammaproteobacteria bacterium]|jgi:lipid-A-disaccharide synthase-like uncharacterized protein
MTIDHGVIINVIWLTIGFGGQAIFSMRFVVQWLCSERQKRSVIPLAFWYLSILGSITLCAYAVHRRDPVFIIGQAFGILVYLRNLYFIYKERQALVNTEG